jgi:hypothetical protein
MENHLILKDIHIRSRENFIMFSFTRTFKKGKVINQISIHTLKNFNTFTFLFTLIATNKIKIFQF